MRAPAYDYQENPEILCAKLPGRWLLERTTPTWRIHDPEAGFQRSVNEDRARDIALAVLDQQRSFPNSIVLATDTDAPVTNGGEADFADSMRFLVIDGQHRLWAQKFSKFDAYYSCVLHFRLSEQEMAKLFLEINDNQRRVPSSLRWDLVRLVQPNDDPYALAAVDIVFELNRSKASPFYQRIDLTGEQKEISIKQGSIAPDIKRFLSLRNSPVKDLVFDQQYNVLLQFFIALKNVNSDGWGDPKSPLYKARVIRAFIRLLPVLIDKIGGDAESIKSSDYSPFLSKVNLQNLDSEHIRAVQGSAGIKAIFDQLRNEIGV